MIKGCIEERMWYENFIRDHKVTIAYPFENFYYKSKIIKRFYRIKKYREKRQLDRKEISIINLMSLASYVSRIGGLLYTMLWYERIPEIIIDMPSSKVEWYVSTEEMSKAFLDVPAKVLEVTLLKAEVSGKEIDIALEAYFKNDPKTLAEIFSKIPIGKVFGVFKLIISFNQLVEDFSRIPLKKDYFDRECIYIFNDLLEILVPEERKDSVTNFCDKYVYDVSSLGSNKVDPFMNPEGFIFYLCLGIEFVYFISKDLIGAYDPITQTMQNIIDEPLFKEISRMYIQFPRDEERYMNFLQRITRWMNEYFGTEISQDELNIDIIGDGTKCPMLPSSGVHKRLEFPTRISNKGLMDIDNRKDILIGLFNAFGHGLENFDGDPITKEEFVYLFDGRIPRPENFKTPYYWNKTDKQFAGLLRLLYDKQPTGIDDIILVVADKGLTKSSVKWSARKQGLGERTLKPIEEQIQNIVYKATGRYLAEVDLKKQNKPKCKK